MKTTTAIQEFLLNLESGKIRAANPSSDGRWTVNTEVKEKILWVFREGHLVDHHGFIDKHTILPQSFSVERNIRLVPGGSSVRAGAHVASGVIIMPPSFINIGAFVDSGTMVDSHVLVGSCAQVGKNVHLSAGVQIGGVLEPIGATPVIIEDNAFIGAGVVLVEGIRVGASAILAPGVRLSKSIPIYDLVKERVVDFSEGIPANAVVVPGSRPVDLTRPWGHSLGIHLSAAIIVKYRDEKSASSTILESVLR